MSEREANDPDEDLNPVVRKLNRQRETARKRGRIRPASDLPEVEQMFEVGIPWVTAVTGGGIPVGSVVYAYGAEQCGKTEDALRACKAAIGKGGIAVYYPTEPLKRSHVVAVGINPNDLLIVEADNGIDALDTIEEYLDEMHQEQLRVDIVVIDSVTAMFTNKGGIIARALNDWLRRVTPKLSNYGTCLWVISQLRTIPRGESAQDTGTGGRGILHYATLKIRYRLIRELFAPPEVTAEDAQSASNYESTENMPEREPVGRLIGISVEKLKGLRWASRTTFELWYNRAVQPAPEGGHIRPMHRDGDLNHANGRVPDLAGAPQP